MRVFNSIVDLREYLAAFRQENKSIGLVPTMGYLHKGHISLIDKSVQENDITVLSIYVNPTQFGPNEDYGKYPSNIENDKKLAQKAGADIVFIPDNTIMYSNNHLTYVTVDKLTDNLCGQSRPTHFRGVTTIVTKLFNIVQPHRAYFGQKDAQQALVIKKMVKDLNMPVDIITCPIVREKDGLALSSRNAYLNNDERKQAPILYQSLQKSKSYIENGERSSSVIKNIIKEMIGEKPSTNIDYISIVSEDTLEDINLIKGNILIALAVKIGNTRLIDNLRMEVM
ncbi:pantothenate synthetase [Vallitalea longa]|uniref:Pantothenate synthetase n=1 Tax=Vallitalea longa TaxID=2936439 RepID=A0A9W6DEJ3_9FIRM|nr:pantoate--beta-alanine ligase [Vallitalea longa]GKX29580.1 pantothenate synthetase [Vallitalea longa]